MSYELSMMSARGKVAAHDRNAASGLIGVIKNNNKVCE